MNMKGSNGAGLISTSSFLGVLLLAEAVSRMLAPGLPADPGKWPRVEIAQKLDQIRRYSEEGKQVEVLFAGSSMMASALEPVVFSRRSGSPAYNAGFAGPSTRTVARWVQDVVTPLLTPEVVVVGVQTREMNDTGAKNRNIYESFTNSPGYKQTTEAIANLEGSLERISYFLRYRRAFREPSRFLVAESAKDPFAGIDLRHEIGPRGKRMDSPGTFKVPRRFIRGLFNVNLKEFALGGVEFEALERLHENLEARGIQLIVLNMPVTAHYWAVHDRPRRDRTAYHRELNRFVRETGVTLVDAEDAFSTTTPFLNPMHLDVEGAKMFSAALAGSWDEILSSEGKAIDLRCSLNGSFSCDLRGAR
jgi:hypothetical protein